jgi:8-oxo-dGTP pyrophosphatase MutT (NUDIX family)
MAVDDARAPSPASPTGLPAAAPLADALGRLLATRTPRTLDDPIPRAGVLVLLYDIGGRPHVVLTRRTDSLPHHPGQVSLPGGRFEPEDGDLMVTALRETEEELGVPVADLRVVGRLDDVPTVASGFIITPFVAHLASDLVPTPSAEEIARVLEVPLADLLAADDCLPVDADVITLRYPMLGEDVWGATARILQIFLRRCREALAGAAPAPQPGA